MVYHPKEIAEAFSTFYEKLYKEPKSNTNDNTETFLTNLHLPSLSEDEAQKMVAEITETETREAIKNLKNNKLPGMDGLPGEFYKCLIYDLVPVLTTVFNYALSKKDPPHTWSEAIISVIHKDGKDPTPWERDIGLSACYVMTKSC